MKKTKLMIPRGYLSYTQVSLWEQSPDEYIRIYLYGGEKFSSKYQKFGKEIHENLENGKKDFITEQIKLLTPNYSLREFEIKTDGDIPLFGILDGLDKDEKKIGDYKTGKKFTQLQTDKSEQITFYNLLIYEKFKFIPLKNYIHWIETKIENNKIFATGKIETFETKRNLKDILKMKAKIQKVAKEINLKIKKELKL